MQEKLEFEKQSDESAFRPRYYQAIQQLNEGQRLAVDSIEGPVLVVAGPGTGKTQILAARIGKILEKTDANPQNILCLTFTDAGAIAMKKRLHQFIGPTAYQVPIFTFHALCNKIIQDNRSEFSDHLELESATDLDVIEILKSILDSLDPEHPLWRAGNKYVDLKGLRNLFSVMKSENFSVEDVENMIDRFRQDLLNDPDMLYKSNTKNGKVGDLKQSEFDKKMASKLRTLEAARLYPIFQQKMEERGLYDYTDMLQWVLNKFETDQDFLLNYQEKYQYILVDEYQDTNGIQNALLYKLVDFWDRPNLFVVGDDDQSIYRFQGANLDNILELTNRFNPSIVVLTQNYRSNQQILDAATYLIGQNDERLVTKIDRLTKELQAEGPFKNSTLSPQVVQFESVEAEDKFIIDELKKIKEEGEIPLSEVAVLYRSHKHADDILAILEKENYPVNVVKKSDILLEPMIAGLLDLCNFIALEVDNPYQNDRLLCKLLYFEFLDFNVKDVTTLIYHYNNKDKEQQEPTLLKLFTDPTQMEDLGIQNPKALENFAEKLDVLKVAFVNDTFQVFFEKVLTHLGILDFVFKNSNKIWRLQIITTLFNYIKEESVKNPAFHLQDLFRHINNLQLENLGVPVNKVLRNTEGVSFTTFHGSKGLEWKKVFLIRGNSKNWESKRGNYSGFNLPKTKSDNESQIELEEQRRLFFVGVTRAQDELVITYPTKHNDKEDTASRFIAELMDSGKTIELKPDIQVEDAALFLINRMTSSKIKEEDLIDHAFVDQKIENLKLSVTAVNKYLKCPLTYYFENILRIPGARTPYLGFGNAIHGTLEALMPAIRNEEEVVKNNRYQKVYDFYLNKFASHFTAQDFEDYKQLGYMALETFLLSNIKQWQLADKVLTEYKIDNAYLDEIPLTGNLDRVEVYGKRVKVADYKTGRNDYKKFKMPKDIEELGGDYTRQIYFYKILIDNDSRQDWTFEEGRMEFILPDRKTGKQDVKEVKIQEDLMEIYKAQIHKVWNGIHNHEFEIGCDDDTCQYCNLIHQKYKFSDLNLGEVEED